MYEIRDLVRYLFDFIQRRTGVLGKQCATNPVGGTAFHGDDRLVRVRLNGSDEHFDLLGSIGRAFCKALHFIGNDGKSTPCFAGHRRLDRRIQRKDIGLLSNIVNKLDDVTDLLRAFAKALDSLRRFLNGFPDSIHAIDRSTHRVATLMRDLN